MISNWRYSPETPNLGQNRQFLEPCNLAIWHMTLKNNRAPLLCYFKLSFSMHHFVAIGDFKLEIQSGNAQFGSKSMNVGAVWPCNLTYDIEKQFRAPLLCYFKLYASFRSHWWIQTGVTDQKRPIWVKINEFFSRVILQFDVWPWKTIGHPFYFTSSFVHHFVAIGVFKLKLESGNAQFGSNSTIFRAVWPWNLTADLEK